ncbi:hypothetical protein SASPL_156409 [Salvia splendens]|uniref:Uncharacterized protein n=1 Tax=Salvia splendens TaxID=180675 RepID=A0A8X8VWQ8_SALSN|nr:hypothetical protein SASPL_156409 [Salvia splendens]
MEILSPTHYVFKAIVTVAPAPAAATEQVVQKVETAPTAEPSKQVKKKISSQKLIMQLIFSTCFLWMILVKLLLELPGTIIHGQDFNVCLNYLANFGAGFQTCFFFPSFVVEEGGGTFISAIIAVHCLTYLFRFIMLQSNITSPFAAHHTQLAMLAQQQALLMAAAANASGSMPKAPNNTQVGLNGTNLPNQSWPNVGYQFPGMMMTETQKAEAVKYMQMGNMGPLDQSEILLLSNIQAVETHAANFFMQPYAMGNNASSNGSMPVAGQQNASSFSSGSSQSGKEYDFSSLTQGFFTKH